MVLVGVVICVSFFFQSLLFVLKILAEIRSFRDLFVLFFFFFCLIIISLLYRAAVRSLVLALG